MGDDSVGSPLCFDFRPGSPPFGGSGVDPFYHPTWESGSWMVNGSLEGLWPALPQLPSLNDDGQILSLNMNDMPYMQLGDLTTVSELSVGSDEKNEKPSPLLPQYEECEEKECRNHSGKAVMVTDAEIKDIQTMTENELIIGSNDKDCNDYNDNEINTIITTTTPKSMEGPRRQKPLQAIRRSRPKRWTTYESQLLASEVAKHGPRDWVYIAKRIGNSKTPDQCSQHWYRVLDPAIKKGKWDTTEDTKLLEAVEKYGMNWKSVSNELIGRTGSQARHRYNCLECSKRRGV